MKADKAHQGKFTVILRREEKGYSVRCVELPGAISEGKTRREALGNIREAIQGYLEAFPEEESRLKVKNEVVQLAIWYIRKWTILGGQPNDRAIRQITKLTIPEDVKIELTLTS